MAKQSRVQIPEVRDPASQVAAAAHQAIEQVQKASRFSEAGVVWNDHDTHVVKGNPRHCHHQVHEVPQAEQRARLRTYYACTCP